MVTADRDGWVSAHELLAEATEHEIEASVASWLLRGEHDVRYLPSAPTEPVDADAERAAADAFAAACGFYDERG